MNADECERIVFQDYYWDRNVRENSYRCEFQYRDDFLISYRVYMMTGLFHISLFEGTLHVDKIHVSDMCDSKSQTLRMRYPFQSTGRPIFTPKLLVGLRLHYTVARFRTGAKFSSQYNNRGEPTRGDSRRHDVLWWYHVNKCRAMRGNRSELALVRKSPRCHVNTSCRYCK